MYIQVRCNLVSACFRWQVLQGRKFKIVSEIPFLFSLDGGNVMRTQQRTCGQGNQEEEKARHQLVLQWEEKTGGLSVVVSYVIIS